MCSRPLILYSLTAYQTEIDSLTKRSKSAENAFLSLYKVLAEAPDPYPLLEAAVVSCHNTCTPHELSFTSFLLGSDSQNRGDSGSGG